MSKYISDLTKHDIISILKNGLDVVQQSPYLVANKPLEQNDEVYTARINIYGKLDELDFLSRIYDLESMESYDSRFKDFKGDIIQHRYNNYDWEDDWIFNDDRLMLFEDDEHFLNFIKEIFDPYVREEKSSWKMFLDNINDLLKVDGYELYETSKISGRAKYGWKRISSIKKKNKTTYELHMIGTGSYANVFYYFDEDYDKKIALKRALKTLNEEEIIRFKNEFIELKKLKSPYVVEVYKYNEENNEYTMEFLDYTLFNYIQKNNSKLSLKDRANLVNQFLKGINYIHSKNMLHRDLSYSNVLIKELDSCIIVKISDFGLVKTQYSDLTRTDESIKGTLHDPNLDVVGYKNYSMCHEIYSIMFIINYIMTGRQDISQCKDIELKKLLIKGIDTNMENRYKNVNEIINAFRNYFYTKKD